VRALRITSLALLLGGCYSNQHALAPGLPSGQLTPQPEETTARELVVRLEGAVGTDLSQAGDRVVAYVATPLVDRAGRTLVPNGARVVGRVTHSVNGKGVTPPRLELVFERLVMNGRPWRIHGVVASQDVELKSPGADPDIVGRGRFGGALVGMIFFNLPGAVVGYSIGGAGAGVKAIADRPASARLPAGSFLTLKLLLD
jgi:hypothetical protein